MGMDGNRQSAIKEIRILFKHIKWCLTPMEVRKTIIYTLLKEYKNVNFGGRQFGIYLRSYMCTETREQDICIFVLSVFMSTKN